MILLNRPSWVPLICARPGDVLAIESSRMYYRPEATNSSEARFISIRGRTGDMIFASPPCTRIEHCAQVPLHLAFAFHTRGVVYLIPDGDESWMHIIGEWVQVVAVAPECIWRGLPAMTQYIIRDDN